MSFLVSAFILGLLGSTHCLGMCGPIVLALPISSNRRFYSFFSLLLYSLGRMFTYALLGALFGLAGKGLRLAGAQQGLSIALGILMLASVVFPYFFKNIPFYEKLFSPVNQFVQTGFRKYFAAGKLHSFLILGLLNGLLPCGLVYVALASAMDGSSPFWGALFMFVFGLGTSPLLSALGWIKNLATFSFKKIINKVLPFIIVLMGVLFIIRGMGLGIKFLSPPEQALEIHQVQQNAPSCH